MLTLYNFLKAISFTVLLMEVELFFKQLPASLSFQRENLREEIAHSDFLRLNLN